MDAQRAHHASTGPVGESIEQLPAMLQRALQAAPHIDLSWLPPRRSAWAMSDGALRFLAALVAEVTPRRVLEFGAGLSTRVLARACAALDPPASLRSFDHDPEFLEQVRASLACGEAARTRLELAPLVARPCADAVQPTYCIPDDADLAAHPADLVVIDGPPAPLGGREGILYQVMDYSRPGTLVLLDDAARETEQGALRRWRENLGPAIEVHHLPGLTKGMAAIIVRRPVPRARLWDHLVELSAGELRNLLRPGEKLILVDEGQWKQPSDLVASCVPFPEHNGHYAGPPPDSVAALRELRRLLVPGTKLIAFASHAFWWLEHYSALHDYLQAHCRCELANARLKVFRFQR